MSESEEKYLTISADKINSSTIGWVSCNWSPVSSCIRIGDVELTEEKLKKLEALLVDKPTNCPNCGAVLKNGICAYCGTEC